MAHGASGEFNASRRSIAPHGLLIDVPPEPPSTRRPSRPFGYGLFNDSEETISWRDSEVVRLQALLTDRPARVDHGTAQADVDPMFPLIEQLESGEIGKDAARRIIAAVAGNRSLAEAVVGLESVGELSSLVERWHQRKGLERLRAAVDDPDSSTEQFRRVIQDESWIFGGRYAQPYIRERIPVLDRLGVPLIRSDGAIHAVEVERANLPELVIRDGDDFFVGPELQAAVGRAINQLRLLDAHEGEIRRELVVECRRASATVVAGHPTYLADPAMANDERVMEAIRIYNSHLSGIEVVTYQELVEGAERALLVSVQVTDSADRDLESDFI